MDKIQEDGKSIAYRLGNLLKGSNEFLGVAIGIFTSIVFILSQLDKIDGIGNKELLIAMDLLNILVLAIALVSIKSSALGIAGNEISKLKKHLFLNDEIQVGKIRERSNELVRQLVYCIRWFSIILGMFYLLQLITDITLSGLDGEIQETLKNTESILDLISSSMYHKVESSKYLTIEIFTNATNLFSAAYLFLAFQVLFLITIDDDNKTWRLKSYVPFSIALVITIANVILFFCGINNNKLSNISHAVRLAGGVYNGLAMLLLFSRFIAMEYFFQKAKKNWQRNFYFYGIVIVLPLYVIAQPMYGVFNATETGESAVLFKSIVFLVCFWGKLFFLLFIYTMLKKKWIHTYLFVGLTQKDTLSNISKDLEDVDDL